MILLWMLIASGVGALAGMTALALEGAARALGRQTRLPWGAALLFAATWPAWLLIRGTALHRPGETPVGAVEFPPLLLTTGRGAVALVAHHLPAIGGRMSLAVLVAWLLVSTTLVVRLLLGMRSLHRQRASWATGDIDGVRVLVTPTTGPAVVGVRRPTIVLPEWALMLDAPLRELVLRHELEHVRARDTVLRLLGALLPALMPWNVALWWLADRLMLAIEVDCDARVLRADAPRERYGLLLLAIAQRQSTTMLAPALSEATSHLERRITAMQRLMPHRPVLVAAGFTTAAALSFALACSAPAPDVPTMRPTEEAASNVATTPLDRAADQTRPYFDFKVDKQAAAYPDNPHPRYPAGLQKAGIGGEVLVQFVIDTTGHVEMSTFRAVKSANDLFTASIRSVLPGMRFHAAEVAGRHVKELVTQPFTFVVSAHSAP